jgi:type VI secretion system protein ImpG
VSLRFDEDAFEGTGVFILGAVLEQFLRRYVSLNSFTETVILSQQRGEIIRWPARIGKRHLI